VNGGQVALSATATSGLTVAFSVLTPTTCSLGAGTDQLSALAIGTCTVEASQPGDGSWLAATPVTQSIQVLGTAQTVTFPVPADMFTGATTPLTASASSGFAVSYTSTSPSVCSVQNAAVTGIAPGTCSITASQAGGTIYAAASASVSFSVLAQPQQSQSQPQQLLATPPPASISGSAGTFDLAGSATSGLPVSYSSQTPGTCSVSTSGKVTFLAAGTCSVTLSQDGDSQYNPATTQTDSFLIKPISQAIAVGAPPAVLTAGSSPSLGASATSGLAPTYTSVTPSVCSAGAEAQVALLEGGTCTVDVSQEGGGLYSAAAQAQVTFVVAREPQVITVGTVRPVATGTGAHTSASASSGLAITYKSLTPEVCHVGATGTVLVQSSGICTVQAIQAGNKRWLPASVRSSFNVVASPAQDIRFSLPSHALSGALPIKLAAHGLAGASFVYRVMASSTSLCWTRRASLYLPRAGSCAVKAVETSDGRSATATVNVVGARSFVVTAQPANGRSQTVPLRVISSDGDGIKLEGLGTPRDGRAWSSGDRVMYSPSTTFKGSVTFAYRLVDSLGRQASSTVTVIVPDAAPAITPAHVAQVAGSALYVRLKAQDSNMDRLSVSAPGGKSLAVQVVGTGLVLRPAPWSSGVLRLWVSVTDSSGEKAGAWVTDSVSPAPASRAHWTLAGGRQTTISWSPSPTAHAGYVVALNGRVACATTSSACTVNELVGPANRVSVKVIGRGGTRSPATAATFAHRAPVLIAVVYFSTASWALSPRSSTVIAATAQRLKADGFATALVSGYTDSYGSKAYNVWLSHQRSLSVSQRLFALAHIVVRQAWFGESDPVGPNQTPGGASLNRRVSIYVY
jgi:outer membrane protein OmpA-like peptidoglycan-associated protein